MCSTLEAAGVSLYCNTLVTFVSENGDGAGVFRAMMYEEVRMVIDDKTRRSPRPANLTLPRVTVLFPTLFTVIHELITISSYTRTLVVSIHHGRLLCSVQLGAACYKIPAPWYSGRYWVRGSSRKVDANTEHQTMPTRLAIALSRTSIPCTSIPTRCLSF